MECASTSDEPAIGVLKSWRPLLPEDFTVDRSDGQEEDSRHAASWLHQTSVVLIIVPLLALSTDQFAKFKEGSQA